MLAAHTISPLLIGLPLLANLKGKGLQKTLAFIKGAAIARSLRLSNHRLEVSLSGGRLIIGFPVALVGWFGA